MLLSRNQSIFRAVAVALLALLLFGNTALVPAPEPAAPSFRPTVASYKKPFVVRGAESWVERHSVPPQGTLFNYADFFEAHIGAFAGQRYGAGAAADLRGYREGMTLVNFKSMDCVTFIENFMGLALTARERAAGLCSEDQAMKRFVDNLTSVRYYNASNCVWEDRIYYFTHALKELEDRGLVENVAEISGEPFQKRINYVSAHSGKYPGIKNWTRMKQVERNLSNANMRYYPLDKIEQYRPFAQTGDIVALATSVKGLDVSHCGFIHCEEDDLYFTHASSIAKKIVFKEDLRHYLSKRTTITGIFVFRPTF